MDTSDKTKNNFNNKIPRLTLLFWITKITATTFGETGGLNYGTKGSSLILLVLLIVLIVYETTGLKRKTAEGSIASPVNIL